MARFEVGVCRVAEVRQDMNRSGLVISIIVDTTQAETLIHALGTVWPIAVIRASQELIAARAEEQFNR